MTYIPKFKVWDTRLKKMYPAKHLSELLDKPEALEDSTAGDLLFLPFIGKYAKDGVEIYNGDILKILTDFVGDEFLHTDFGVVEWHETRHEAKPGFEVRLIPCDGGNYEGFLFYGEWPTGRSPFDEIHVLGNIYETPELIPEELKKFYQ